MLFVCHFFYLKQIKLSKLPNTCASISEIPYVKVPRPAFQIIYRSDMPEEEKIIPLSFTVENRGILGFDPSFLLLREAGKRCFF